MLRKGIRIVSYEGQGVSTQVFDAETGERIEGISECMILPFTATTRTLRALLVVSVESLDMTVRADWQTRESA